MLPLQRGSLEVRFALGDLASSTTRKPLCVACDPRWNWHEFGHVLLAAATGELEFRFAHSAGDALGAILSDPKSKLASEAGWRGLSFPWIFLPRRHDRAVEDGWGWSGSLYLGETSRDGSHVAEAHGYRSEQILSSSLFRLYRAMGGDAGGRAPPRGRRKLIPSGAKQRRTTRSTSSCGRLRCLARHRWCLRRRPTTSSRTGRRRRRYGTVRRRRPPSLRWHGAQGGSLGVRAAGAVYRPEPHVARGRARRSRGCRPSY